MNNIAKSAGRLLISLMLLFTLHNSNIYAATTLKATPPLKRTEAFIMLKKANSVQLFLGQKPRSKENIKKMLYPYFTSQYTEFFIKECMVNDGQGWYIPASDVMDGFIPLFSYDNKTKITYSKDRKATFVLEEFPANNEGPVAWDEHTERVTIKKTKPGWRVTLIEWLK